jgi:hypothetical protein
MKVRWLRVGGYFITTVLATQAVSALVAAVRGPVSKGDMLERLLRTNLAMLVPGVVALIFARFVLRQPVRTALDLRWRPNLAWLVAWLLPAAMTALALAVALRAPGARLAAPTGMLALIPLPTPLGGLAFGLLAAATVLPGALGEELGWRGLLRTELEPLGFWPSSLVIGLLWAGWHMPAVFLGGLAGGTVVGALGLTLLLVLATPIAMALCRRGASVWPAALIHASGSASGMVAGALVKGGHGVLPAMAPLVPVSICLLALVAFPRLRGDPKSSPPEPAA